jgi:uncharacterized protein
VSAAESRGVVMAAWTALASRDPERIARWFTPDAEWLAPADNATALALRTTHAVIGREAIAQAFGVEVWKLFARDFAIEIKRVCVEETTVVLEARLSATLANGNAYDNDYCFVFEVEAGRVRRVREYMDTAKGHRMVFGNGGASPLAS